MPHYVCRKGKYWSLEASVRVPGKKNPVKKRLAYFGTRNPNEDQAQARYQQMLATAERKGREWDDYQRREYGETASERKEREEEEAKFSPKDFLAQSCEVEDDAASNDAENGEEGAGDEGGDDGLSEGHD